MEPARRSGRSVWLLLGIVVSGALLGAISMTGSHEWEGDSFGYVMQAQGLISGDAERIVDRTAFSMEESSYAVGPSAYPWGYPGLLVPPLLLFGENLRALKAVSVITFCLFLVCLFVLLRPRVPETVALTIVALFAVNPLFASYHDLLMSDIPFLFLSTLSLVLIDAFTSADRPPGRQLWLGAVVGAAIYAAFFTRTNGVLLLPVVAVAQLAGRGKSQGQTRGVLAASVPYLTFVGLHLAAMAYVPMSVASHVTHLDRVSSGGVLYNVVYYAALPSVFFEVLPLDRVLYVLTLPLVVLGLLSSDRRDYGILAYCGLTYLLYVAWPWRSGVRFLFPILPFYLYFLYRGASRGLDLLRHRSRRRAGVAATGAVVATLAVFLTVSVLDGASNRKSDGAVDGPYGQASLEMFDFVESATMLDDVIVFFRPRIMSYQTGRRSILINECGRLSAGQYYVYHHQLDRHNQVPLDQLDRCRTSLVVAKVFDNAAFTVFRVGGSTEPVPERARP